MIFLALEQAGILILLAVLTTLILLNTRRTHRIMTQSDDVLAATNEVVTEVGALKDQQAKTVASVTSTLARVEAVIAALTGQNNPQLEAAINSLHLAKDDLASVITTEAAEQTTLDAERPDPPPPAGPTPIA